eukprot:COSAG06_NODE_4250_length_4433_cov_1.907014_8_plen_167_part_01
MAFALGTLEFLLVMAMAALFIDATGIAGRQENGLSCSAFASIQKRSFYQRQARDKHRESSTQKESRGFPTDFGLKFDESPNNYANTSAPPQFADYRSPQHRECADSHLILFLGSWAMFMSPILMVLSLVLDPEPRHTQAQGTLQQYMCHVKRDFLNAVSLFAPFIYK